jgi:hypothetical protein
MKKFILNTLAFLVILLSIDIVLYFLVDKIYWKIYSKGVKLNYNSFLLSDSHGEPLDNLTEKFGIYNFSAGSDSYFDMYRKTKYLIANTAVDTIIITVDDHTLSIYREKMNNLDRSFCYANLDDYNNSYELIKEKYIKHFIVFFNPKSRSIIGEYIKSKLFSIIKTRKENVNTNWQSLSSAEKKERAINRANSQFRDSSISKSLSESIKNIIEICKENEIVLIGIKYPLSQNYIDIIHNRSFKADSIFLDYNLKVYDFTNIYAGNDEYFADQDHLNSIGSQNFVNIIRNSFKK